MATHLPDTGFIRQAQLLEICPVSKSTLWRWVKENRFPRPIKISARVSAWRCEDVRAWIEKQSDIAGHGVAA